ncbi:MAG: hypothetical protein IPJ31_06910 [Bacteroidetes bacterium]|nr:hypothetical protein [Bacteroidota bacterium]
MKIIKILKRKLIFTKSRFNAIILKVWVGYLNNNLSEAYESPVEETKITYKTMLLTDSSTSLLTFISILLVPAAKLFDASIRLLQTESETIRTLPLLPQMTQHYI